MTVLIQTRAHHQTHKAIYKLVILAVEPVEEIMVAAAVDAAAVAEFGVAEELPAHRVGVILGTIAGRECPGNELIE
jgi:hypothetical protein